MKLSEPFVISARLMPALKIGDGWLSLEKIEPGVRQTASIILDYPGGEYRNDSLSSGVQGFGGIVEVFATYLSFLAAAVEGYQYEQRTGRKSDNADMFPQAVTEFLADNYMDIESLQMELEDESGMPREALIHE